MMEQEVYLGLGGNIGDTFSILQSALQQIERLDIADFKVSRFYYTQPVSDMAQRWFINAVCRFKTKMSARELLVKLQQIEAAHGKVAKPKNAPRAIDIDLLFFGNERHYSKDCEVPHPRWKKRLFVIKPLLDLTATIAIPGMNDEDCDEYIDLAELIQTFPDHGNCKLIEEIYASYTSK